MWGLVSRCLLIGGPRFVDRRNRALLWRYAGPDMDDVNIGAVVGPA